MGAVVEIDQPRERPAKRQRLNPHYAPQWNLKASRIFAPYRTVGLVSPTPVPFTAQPLGKTTFHITTSAGRCLQSYDLRKGLNLVFITRPQTPGPITATAAWADKVLAAWSTGGPDGEKSIWIFKRGKKIVELAIPDDLEQDVVEIVVFGSWLVGCCGTAILVWDSRTLELYTTLWPPFAGAGSTVLTGGVVTMPTFTNKIFAGRADGTVEIWNVSTGRLLHRTLPPDSDVGAVSALQPTPALALLAIAYANGLVTIHDVSTDQEVRRLHAGQGGQCPITSISFRTDGLGAGLDGQQDGVMATASFRSGDVTLWDLNEGGKRIGVMRGAHSGPTNAQGAMAGGVSKIEFLPSQAILVTTGDDNLLRTWIFDQTPFSPLPRPLHSRAGHGAPITTLNFLPVDADGADSTGKWLMSTSKDRSLWSWSLRRDGQSTELSQGAIQKKANKTALHTSGANDRMSSASDLKAPEIRCVACSLTRDGGMGAQSGDKAIWANSKQVKGKSTATDQNLTGWESVVTGHVGDKYARTWFWGRKRAGRWALETGDGAEVTSVAISPCGTFALIGSAAGGIDMYNLQSGLHRQRFPARLTPMQAKRMEADESKTAGAPREGQSQWARGLGKHTRAVTGVQVDNLNRNVISCGLDGRVKFWDFMTGTLLHQLDWHATTTIRSMRYHRPSNLLALSCTDSTTRIIDIETRKTVRELSGPATTPINDTIFSHDGRWIITASADAVIRVWDLPTGQMIDAIRLQSPCRALAFSSTGEYLATAQEGSVGIDIWTNRTLFTHVPTRAISEADIADVAQGPTASGEDGQNVIDFAHEPASGPENPAADNEECEEHLLPQTDQLSARIETLSLVPRSRWQTLLHLEAIRARNKPVEPPKAPEKAPFFLPSLEGPREGRGDALALLADGNVDGNGEKDKDKRGATTATSADRSRIMVMDRDASASRFTTLLRQTQSQDLARQGQGKTQENANEAFITHLKTLSPSATDVEIRSLGATAPYTELVSFVEALTQRLRARKDYEMVQTWMAVFLRCHGEVVGDDVEAAAGAGERENAVNDGGEDGDAGALAEAMRKWRQEQKREAERLGALAGYCAGVVGFLRSAR